MPAPSPADRNDLPCRIEVTVDGRPVSDAYQFWSLRTENEMDGIPFAEIDLLAGGEGPIITDSMDFIPGNFVEIEAGYEGHPLVPVFRGLVVKHHLRMEEFSTHLVITCKHRAAAATLTPKQATFTDTTDSAVIKTLTDSYDLAALVIPTRQAHEELVQSGVTDWDFISSRAKVNGHVVLFQGNNLTIGPPCFDSPAELALQMGESILSFEAVLDSERQPAYLTGSDVLHNDQPPAPRTNAMTGSVGIPGSTAVYPGDQIELNGVGGRFSGLVYVSSVKHSFEQGKWITTLGLGWHSRPGVPAPGSARAAGSLHAAAGTPSSLAKNNKKTNIAARRITTELDWNDLVVDISVLEELQELRDWLMNAQPSLKDQPKKRGFHALFYGPPGTGKRLSASLLGKITGSDVYRVDLSMVVPALRDEGSEDIDQLFRQAESKRWILFFDEADALFGKRTALQSANDRYANAEVVRLLDLMVHYPGLVILSTNLKASIDPAFIRRLSSTVLFKLPEPELRLRLWRQVLEDKKVDEVVNIDYLARDFQLAGGAIANAARYAFTKATNRGDGTIRPDDLLSGIRSEFSKEGRPISSSDR